VNWSKVVEYFGLAALVFVALGIATAVGLQFI
jgi:hypothetical protein